MSKKLIIAGGVAVGMVIGYLAVSSWFESTRKELRAMGIKVEKEAKAFAKTHSESECVDHALAKVYKCDGITCRAGVAIFLEKCLPPSKPTAGICDGVPKHDDILAAATWAVGYCESKSSPQPKECANLMNKLAAHCETPRDRSGAAQAKKAKKKKAPK